VVDIDGDGSFLMNIQELATAHIEKIAAKAIVLNNQHLGMVMQWEDKFYKGNRGHTYLGDPDNRKQIYPDYITIARGFNVPCERVMYKKDLRRRCSGCWTRTSRICWMSSFPTPSTCCRSSRRAKPSRR